MLWSALHTFVSSAPRPPARFAGAPCRLAISLATLRTESAAPIAYKHDVFAAVVGHLDDCPDGTNAAWIWLAVPDEHDSNRSRWPTDPLLRAVQSASFLPAPAPARRLIWRRQQLHDVARLDTGMYGYLVSRMAHTHPSGGQYDVSMALGETQRALQKEATKPGKDFGELVRERRQRFGLPNPPAIKVLPFPVGAPRTPSLVRAREDLREGELAATGADSGQAARESIAGFTQLAMRSAGRRMEEALDALEAAALRNTKPRELEGLEAAFLSAEAAYQAATASRSAEATNYTSTVRHGITPT